MEFLVTLWLVVQVVPLATHELETMR